MRLCFNGLSSKPQVVAGSAWREWVAREKASTYKAVCRAMHLGFLIEFFLQGAFRLSEDRSNQLQLGTVREAQNLKTKH